MNKFEIPLFIEPEFYKMNDDASLEILVYWRGKMVAAQDVNVQISLSKNGAIGFGTELIREALKAKFKDTHWHLDPTIRGDRSSCCEGFGAYLHPDSPEIIFEQYDTGKFDIDTVCMPLGVNSAKKYVVDTCAQVDNFRQDDDNIMSVVLHDKDSKQLLSGEARVQLIFTRSAMLSFGTAILRKIAEERLADGSWRLQSKAVEESMVAMGVFLTPESPDLIINQVEFGNLNTLLNLTGEQARPF